MKDSKSIKDLKNINTELSTILEMFVKKVAQSDSFEVESWLKKNNFNAIADIRLLQNYLQRTFQLFRKQWMEDGYEDYWQARTLTKTNFRRADAELLRIIKALIEFKEKNMINTNAFIFLLGGLTFLCVFSFFKDAAMEVFKKELAANEAHDGVWSKLFKVFFVDWLICVLGVLATGVLFVVIFNLAH